MEANVWMTGRVGGEVELRDAASPWATFRLGCTPRVVRGGEWGDEQTIWVTVSCGGRLAEHVKLSVDKGDAVIVGGRLRLRQWADANGVEHQQFQIRAATVGHDLTSGCSSFYRLKRTPSGEVVTVPEDDEPAGDDDPAEGATVSGVIDIETLAALAAEEFDEEKEVALAAS